MLVPKPDGSMPFCINYRKLNGVSSFDAYPMPQVDSLLEVIGGARMLSTIDLNKG